MQIQLSGMDASGFFAIQERFCCQDNYMDQDNEDVDEKLEDLDVVGQKLPLSKCRCW